MRYLCCYLLCAAGLAAATYTIKPEPNAKFTLEVHKTGLMSGKVHVFDYERYAGKLDFDPANPEGAKIDLIIRADSIVCRDTWIDEKDRKKVTQTALDVMQFSNHPEMHFVSNSVTRRSDNGFDVAGELSIKGIAKPIVVSVTMEPAGSGWIFTGKAVVLRKSYKINPPAPVPFGIIGNKEEMPMSFTLVATPGRN